MWPDRASASHLHLFFTIAIPMDVLIINYRVYYMTLGRAASTSNEVSWTLAVCHCHLILFFTQRRRGMIFDLAVGIGIPALVDILCECTTCGDQTMSINVHPSVYPTKRSIFNSWRLWLLSLRCDNFCLHYSVQRTPDVDCPGMCGVFRFVNWYRY